MKLSGLVCVRNGFELDYCWREAVHSLLPICDEVVICDGESTDGTSESIDHMVVSDSRIRAICYPWPNPERDLYFWVNWLNWARAHLRSDMMIQLDADEILDPCGYDTIKRLAGEGASAFFKRFNYWKDTRHLAPHGRACGVMVARLGPTALYLPSDEPHPRHYPNIRSDAMRQPNEGEHPDLFIHHLGFLRKNDAFVRKADLIPRMFFGSTDPRISEQAATGKRWDERDYFDGIPLEAASRMIPEIAHAWLRERGYEP